MREILHTAALAIAADARMIARIADPAERAAILEIARALRNPAAVARLLGKDTTTTSEADHAHTRAA
jgi:hypothetical protein